MRVLVTGGSGFIGTNIVDFYLKSGAEVLNLDLRAPPLSAHQRVWTQGDVLDSAKLSRIVGSFGATHVLHMAARTDLLGRTLADYAANTAGVANLIDALKGLESLKRLIVASSRMVCTIGYQPKSDEDYCPSTVYGESKVETERLLRARAVELPWTIVRPSSIWGPWFDVPYKDFFLSVARGRYVHIGRRRILKSFGFVGNSVYQLNALLVAQGDLVEGKTFYLADYPPLELSQWAELIRSELGGPRIRRLPYLFLWMAAAGGDAFQKLGWKRVPLTRFRLDNMLTEMIYDLRQLEEIVGPLPYSLREGTRQTVHWLVTHKEAQADRAALHDAS